MDNFAPTLGLLTPLGTFLSLLRPPFLHHLRQPLSTCRGEMVALLLAASGSMGNRTPLRSGFWSLTFQCCYGLIEPVSFALQFNYYSCCIQNILLRLGLADCNYASAISLDEKGDISSHERSGFAIAS